KALDPDRVAAETHRDDLRQSAKSVVPPPSTVASSPHAARASDAAQAAVANDRRPDAVWRGAMRYRSITPSADNAPIPSAAVAVGIDLGFSQRRSSSTSRGFSWPQVAAASVP